MTAVLGAALTGPSWRALEEVTSRNAEMVGDFLIRIVQEQSILGLKRATKYLEGHVRAARLTYAERGVPGQQWTRPLRSGGRVDVSFRFQLLKRDAFGGRSGEHAPTGKERVSTCI